MANATTDKKTTDGQEQTTPVGRWSAYKRRNNNSLRWLRYIIGALLLSLIIAVAYYIFFRPYLYLLRPCKGEKHYEVCVPSGYSIFGIDVSRHQGSINWTLLKEAEEDAPISFVYIKATEGSDFTDVNFSYNFVKAKENGITRGAYHYFSKHSGGLAQAEQFINRVNLEKGDLPPVVDVEEYPKNKKKFLQELKIFITKIEEHYGVKPIIYSYKKYIRKYLRDPFFQEYPLWIAHYYVPRLDEGTEWLMWQCSDRGGIKGVETSVDINVFNGNAEQFKSILIK